MARRVVAVAAVALYVLLAFLATVVNEYHDRYYPQSIGVSSQAILDFSQSTLEGERAIAELQQLDAKYHLDAFKLLPDLDRAGAQVFVDLDEADAGRQVQWFGGQEPGRIVGVERLANSAAGGTYLIVDDRELDEALSELSRQGVAVKRTDASPTDSVIVLAQEPGFIAPVIAACALIAAMTVFWLAIRARSRALRVLAGSPPWRIHVQDLGSVIGVLAASAVAVAIASAILIGAARGWVFVPSFLAILGIFEFVTLAIAIVVALLISAASWPSAELFARRIPPVRSLRWAAKIVQALTLVALIAFVGPAWTASLNAAQTARQLEAWNHLSDQVQLAFGVDEQYLDVLAPQVADVVDGAEDDRAAALSYTISQQGWQGDFGAYSAIALVNSDWIALISDSVGADALDPVPLDQVSEMLHRELGPSLELWGAEGTTVTAALSGLAAFVPADGVQFPLSVGGSVGKLEFLNEVLILRVPSIAGIFDAQNIVSLASTGNITFASAETTDGRLQAAGLDPDGLAELGVPGTIRTVYAAEQGILEAQFATYLARLLAASIFGLAISFLVAATVNATISGLLNARRDFPIRVSGATWQRIIGPRALRETGIAALIATVVVVAQPQGTMGVTIAVALLGMAALYLSHWVAAPMIFARLIRRKL